MRTARPAVRGVVDALLAVGAWAAIAGIVAVPCSTVSAQDARGTAETPTTTPPLRTAVSALEMARTRLQQLDEGDLKRVYLACSREANVRRMDGGEAAFCSVAYDVLLKGHFAGDFHAFLAWSRVSERPGGVP